MITSHETIRVDNEPQFVFGQLVKLAFEHGIASYHSDLYHDAQWLQEHWQAIQDAGVFFYSVRETGTCIGLDEKLVIRMDDGRLFRCVLPPASTELERKDWWQPCYRCGQKSPFLKFGPGPGGIQYKCPRHGWFYG